MPRPTRRPPTKLADVQLPWWHLHGAVALVIARLIGELRKRRALDKAEESLTELAELLAQRSVEGDERDERVAELTERMTELTERMESYGRTSVRLAAASLAVASVALIVAALTGFLL